MINQVFNEDCLVGMKRIPSESVDLCVIDPPYRITSGGKKDSAFRGASGRKRNHLSSGGKIFEHNDVHPSAFMNEIYRVLKNRTHFYCMTNDKNLKTMLMCAEESGFKLHNILVWRKGMHTPSQFYLKNIEYILFLRKGEAKYINNMGSYSLIDIPGVFGDKIHPSEKPVELIKHMIKNSSNNGDTVLDCFMGSGTTAIACLETNRNYIGFEKDSNYYELLQSRIEEHGRQLILF